MGAALGSLRDQVSGFMGNLFGDGSVEEPDLDLERGDLSVRDRAAIGQPIWGDLTVQDTSGAIKVFKGVPYQCPPFATVKYDIPKHIRVTQWISPRTRQRDVHIQLEYPLLDTDEYLVEDEDGLDKNNPLPYVKIVPIISEDYQYIVVHAPPYHSIGFKVTNVQIVYMEPKWNGLRREYSVHAYFKGPNDAARYKLKYETPFPSLYQQPPP